MKNRYTTVYLYLFIADSSLLILRSLLNAAGIQVLEGPPFSWVEMGFHFLIIPLAVVQVIIAYRQKQKKAAKIIGLYPLFFIVFGLLTFVGLLFSNASQLVDKNMTSFMQGITTFSLLVSIVQLSIGIWAAKDLASGHFITEIKPPISTKKILMKCSIASLAAVVLIIIAGVILFRSATSDLLKVPNDLVKYYPSVSI